MSTTFLKRPTRYSASFLAVALFTFLPAAPGAAAIDPELAAMIIRQGNEARHEIRIALRADLERSARAFALETRVSPPFGEQRIRAVRIADDLPIRKMPVQEMRNTTVPAASDRQVSKNSR